MSLSLPDLDSHLFKCADIIRDAVDPTDYEEFILPLVYYKAISDEYEKQTKRSLRSTVTKAPPVALVMIADVLFSSIRR